ncbi:hypothetical protein [Mycobacterium sp.]|uniref:hypothetical protein n=1 Tax=Mycobacterium sp. TaxID=1785 RepID=UPI003F9A4DC3
MLVDLMGMGKAPAEIATDSAMFHAVSVQYEQAVAAAADVLGLKIEEIRPAIETATCGHDVVVRCATLLAGTVIGQKLSWTAYHAGRPALVVQQFWTTTNDIPGWDLALDHPYSVRVLVEGSPPMRLDLIIRTDEVEGLPGVSEVQLAIAMTAIRAIPYVLQEPPGVVTAPGLRRLPMALVMGMSDHHESNAAIDRVTSRCRAWRPAALTRLLENSWAA